MELGFRYLVLALLLALGSNIAPASAAGGSWQLLQDSVGVSAMHMQLLHNDRVILFDRTNVGPSNLTFPAGHPCRSNPQDRWFHNSTDCTAHSVEYDVASNTFRALSIVTDTWCSSGYVAPDGTLVQTGGWEDGNRKVRLMPACTGPDTAGACDWSEKLADPDVLAGARWYATNQKLPDGGAIIVGGRDQPNYEFYPKAGPSATTLLPLPFLSETDEDSKYLYPFVHLNVDGNLFVFSNNRAILFDYKSGSVVRRYPTLGDGAPRNNPNAGSSVLLPLKPDATEAEVLICGGAPASSNDAVERGQFPPALRTCGRIKITDPDPAAAWVMEDMPSPRVMGDMILLPNGEVLIINGATDGIAGWGKANTFNPTPVIYRPDFPSEPRPAGAPRPRMYHSSAVLLRDGRVMLGGSNPHEGYVFRNVKYPTELSLEAFSPDYLDASDDERRPNIVDPSLTGAPVNVNSRDQLMLPFRVPVLDPVVSVTMVAPSFTTHTYAQNQRLLFLQAQVNKAQLPGVGGAILPTDAYVATVTMPTNVLAPPGYYMLFVVNGRIPSQGIWVRIQ
ncbi:hypothetical protein SETIT_7G153800v2 [Setaria italica]|uniref:Galactose oxidase-like Early set domain-containing protein n=1 Tax=Setaria italica TaxID=4555 RepID=A0A368RW42_SETIT|nr:hypothetical protein SETIT_7G153800v2 [Setaria italica]